MTTQEKAATLIDAGAEVIELDPKKIKLGWRARQDYGDIEELAEDIKHNGQMQPILVKVSKKSGAYLIIAGMRRKRACQKLGVKVKAIVVEPRNEMHSLGLQLGENIKRKQFDQLEVAEGLKQLKKLYEKAHPETKHGQRGRGKKREESDAPPFVEVAMQMLSVSKSTVRNLMAMSDLPEEVKEEIDQAETTKERNVAAAKAIKGVRQERKKDKLRKQAAEKKAARAEEQPEGEEEEQAVIKLYKEDCFKMMAGMTPESVDLILTDPPYELKRSLVSHDTRSSINDPADVKWDQLNVGWVLIAAPLLAKTGQMIICCPFEAILEYRMVLNEAGLTYRCSIVWHKTNPGTVHRSTYLPSCEAIIWATKGKQYTFQPWDNAGAAEVHNFKEGPICGGDERLDHPAQKPLWLIEELLLRHTNEYDAVLDPFTGAGTTLVACKTHNRYGYGIEKSMKYIKQAKLRLEAI